MSEIRELLDPIAELNHKNCTFKTHLNHHIRPARFGLLSAVDFKIQYYKIASIIDDFTLILCSENSHDAFSGYNALPERALRKINALENYLFNKVAYKVKK